MARGGPPIPMKTPVIQETACSRARLRSAPRLSGSDIWRLQRSGAFWLFITFGGPQGHRVLRGRPVSKRSFLTEAPVKVH